MEKIACYSSTLSSSLAPSFALPTTIEIRLMCHHKYPYSDHFPDLIYEILLLNCRSAQRYPGSRQDPPHIHQGTDAVPTAFDASTARDDLIILCDPSLYPLCHLSDHHSRVGATQQKSPPTILLPLPSPYLHPYLHQFQLNTCTHPTDVSSGDVPETSTRLIPIITSSGAASRATNIPSEASQDIVADRATEGIADTPSQARPILQSTISGGASLQPNEALATIASLPVVAGSLSSPPLMSAPSSAPVGGLHSPTESSVNESDRIPHGQIFSSSSLSTASPRVSREDTSVPTQPEHPHNPASQNNHSSDHSVTEEL
ncbi:hypothetical protein BJV78DRAFT_955663 [Lactifluus subvellereus]|nr:hypothetical protein BJV78DRAFT_955663 [Lactifluus subvellereus]